MSQPASPKVHKPATSSEPGAADCLGEEFEVPCRALMSSHKSVPKVEKKELNSPRTSKPKRDQGPYAKSLSPIKKVPSVETTTLEEATPVKSTDQKKSTPTSVEKRKATESNEPSSSGKIPCLPVYPCMMKANRPVHRQMYHGPHPLRNHLFLFPKLLLWQSRSNS